MKTNESQIDKSEADATAVQVQPAPLFEELEPVIAPAFDAFLIVR